MLAYTYISHGKFELIDKPKLVLQIAMPLQSVKKSTPQWNTLSILM